MNIVYVSTYVPRSCGIATFTSDLTRSVAHETDSSYHVVAMNNVPQGYSYPPEVCFQIQQNRLSDYRRAAEYINRSDFDVVSVQHEFGIFGGPAGRYLLALIGNVRKPVVTTLHTVLKRPTAEYFQSMLNVIQHSERLVVMSEIAKGILEEVYAVPEDKISLIYHGVPDVPFTDPDLYKGQFDVEGRLVILTFGLIGPNKGIEKMLEALPPVVAGHPEVLYIVLGATHPEIRRTQGESYRHFLQERVRDLGLEDNVVFHDRFVSRQELYRYIMASDIFVTPYRYEEQVVSGTLSYALGMGKAIVSTPYWYAQEILADGRGMLVPFDDPGALSRALLALIEDRSLYQAIRERAYAFGRRMVWGEVAWRYVELFGEVLERQKAVAERGYEGFTRDRVPPTTIM